MSNLISLSIVGIASYMVGFLIDALTDPSEFTERFGTELFCPLRRRKR
jgi:hypothetical protein